MVAVNVVILARKAVWEDMYKEKKKRETKGVRSKGYSIYRLPLPLNQHLFFWFMFQRNTAGRNPVLDCDDDRDHEGDCVDGGRDLELERACDGASEGW